MEITQTKLPGVVVINPKIFNDVRGHFLELHQAERYRENGIPLAFVQDNLSHSSYGALRGLHYQLQHPQGKLLSVLVGTIYDVVVDISPSSPTYGQHIGVTLEAEKYQQIYVPPGYAHGFCVLSPFATCLYKCTDRYHPEDERGVIWNDPTLQVTWPIESPVLSPKDLLLPRLDQINIADLPTFSQIKAS